MKHEQIKGRVYISGQISGLKPLVYKGRFRKAFNELAIHYGVHPADIINPANIGDLFPSFDHDDYMAIDLSLLSRCENIYMLKGWENSEGAKIEKDFAEKNNIAIFYEK